MLQVGTPSGVLFSSRTGQALNRIRELRNRWWRWETPAASTTESQKALPPEQRADIERQIAELRIQLMRMGFELDAARKANLNRLKI
jgi:hypothetical protein